MKHVLTAVRPWAILAGCVLVIASLYLARSVLIPVTLAVLLTIVLDPVVTFLQRLIGRAASIFLVVLVVFTVLGLLAWGLSVQAASLTSELPMYRVNALRRIQDVRAAIQGGTLEQVSEAVKDIKREIEQSDEPAPRKPAVPVVPSEKPTDLPARFGPLLEWLASAGLVIVLVIFMLFEREEMRNRLIRLAGRRRLTTTTRALDEAGERISRYLGTQSLINLIFGLSVGLGLFLIGVPYALVWAFLAATLRFIPYVGPWLGALAPIALSLVAFQGWTEPLLVAGLFVALELFTNLVLETVLYAGVAGVSQVGLLVAVAFWTWLWGPAGLLMATPLTVCLVVFAKHVPSFRFVVTLLGDAPALSPGLAYYQRLLAGDETEAMEIVEAALKEQPAERVYDDIMLPTLNRLRDDLEAGAATAEDHRRVLDGTREILDEIATAPRASDRESPGDTGTVSLLGYPAGDDIDEMALRMFRQVLDPSLFSLEIVSGRMLPGEAVAHVQRQGYPLVCIASLPPAPNSRARYLIKRLRAAAPEVKIIIGRWSPDRSRQDDGDLTAAGADGVGQSLAESRTQLYQLLAVVPRVPADREAAA